MIFDFTVFQRRNKVFLILLLFFATGFHHTHAQNDFKEIRFEAAPGDKSATYYLTGTIRDAENAEPIAGVSVHIDGFFTGINTDERGQYIARLDSGKHRIVFRRFGRAASYYIVELYGNGILDVSLSGLDFSLDVFTVLAEQRDRNVKSAITGLTRMNIEEIKLVPMMMGEPDVFNVLQAMPGVTSVGEGSPGLNIRGGQADQNLIMMNEAIVLSNNHALGFLSAFNGDVLQNFSLYKGVIPSYYGGRSAAAINLEMRKGDFDSWKSGFSLGTATSKVILEGPLNPEKTSMIAGVRRSNAKWLLDSVDEPDVRNSDIRFHDIYLGLSHRFSEKHTLDFSLLNTGDFFQFSDQFGFEWNNFVTSLTSKNLLSDNFSLVSLLAYGSFNNGFFEPTEVDAFRVDNGLYYLQGKISGLWTRENFDFTFGAEAVQYQMRPESLSPMGEQSGIMNEKVHKQQGLEFAPFISGEWTPHENFALTAGVRYSQYLQLGPDTVFTYQEGLPVSSLTTTGQQVFGQETIVQYGGFEPRISFRLSLDEANSIKGGYASLYQYLQTISNATGPTPIDLWQLSTSYILPQRSHNFSLGYFRNFGEDEWSTSLEGFYRLTENQLEYRDFADLFLNRGLETELIQGQGRAYGAELMVQRNRGAVTGWLAYTYSRSQIRTVSEFQEIQVNRGDWFPTNFDRPHIVSLVANLHLGRNKSLNLLMNYSTGRPVTAPTTNYVVGGIFIPDFGDRNQYRIPDYFRVDFSYLTNGFVRTWDDRFNFSIYNLLGRRNAYSVFFQREGMSRRLRPYQVSILGAIFPSITYSINFSQ
ncbi:TonB-dependent receptor [Arthrospiribacter ruber]|uniref:TonB-dependent receptor plug domain-containing protein n=1 Tax=Arthrospiribacter ruber TaxID=2487934 RepID=A0A951IZI2_9BACT|nr:carboxypeptidase-like regulatory domain-containing protein [Arthrospiribacter ruber]MBW3470045.1 hypothetical protein [Arthrospiribacter ruber]